METRRNPTDLIAELKNVEAERDQILHDLTERVKELQCLYRLGIIIDETDDIEGMFREFVEFMPAAWQYPEVTCARLTLNELEFPTSNFQETEWGQAADIVVGGTAVGRVDVNYLEARPAEHEGPFLKEERDLIDEIARRLGRATERMWAEAALETMHAEREELEQVVKQKSSLDFDAGIATLSPMSSIARDKIWHDLNERVKELQCLYALGIIIETADNVEDAFQEFMQYLPPAWQYPEVTCSRIQLNDQFFTTSNFQETGWIQSAPIIVGGNQVGNVAVFYLDEMPVEYEGPFLKEERMLIDEIARRLGRAAERIWAEEALDVTHEEREELEQKLRRLRAGSQE